MRDFKKLTTGIVLVMSSLSLAQAQDVKAVVSYDPLGLNAGTYLDTLTAASSMSSGAASVSATSDDFVRPDNASTSVGYHSSYMRLYADANTSGSMSSSVNLVAGGLGIASSVWRTSFVNGLDPMSYTMAIDINGGSVSLGGWTQNPSTRNMQGGFFADISVNGQSVWSSSQTLSLNGSGFTFTQSGTPIGHQDVSYTPAGEYFYDQQRATYEISRFTSAVNLGSFAAGQLVDVAYTLSSFVRLRDPDGCPEYECGIGSYASISDPLEISGTAGPRITAAVPEPETYAMLLAGLGLIGGIARRRKQKAIAA